MSTIFFLLVIIITQLINYLKSLHQWFNMKSLKIILLSWHSGDLYLFRYLSYTRKICTRYFRKSWMIDCKPISTSLPSNLSQQATSTLPFDEPNLYHILYWLFTIPNCYLTSIIFDVNYPSQMLIIPYSFPIS